MTTLNQTESRFEFFTNQNAFQIMEFDMHELFNYQTSYFLFLSEESFDTSVICVC